MPNGKTEKLVLRLPLGMRDQVAELSKKNRRSMNSQIIWVLEEAIKQEGISEQNTTADAIVADSD